MGGLITYLSQTGIVRVLSVPIAMSILIYILWILATPPPLDDHDDEGQPHKS
ncbi:MAG TPA: hypothetical protein VIX59_17885 [Candidatus Binataceae bacterium]|jgi:hypothetical protein